MRIVGAFIAASCLTGVFAVGCGSKTTAPPGTGGSSSSTTVSSTSSSSSSSSSGVGGGGGAGGGAGGAPAGTIDCTLPAKPPSGGSCVAFMTDAGVELDAGVNDAGTASATTCNPITNEGCTGTDVCNPDNSDMFYDCQPAGTPAGLACGAMTTSMTVTCAPGGLAVQLQSGMIACVQMCCTAADCGGSPSTCDTTALTMPLPSSVGICVSP